MLFRELSSVACCTSSLCERLSEFPRCAGGVGLSLIEGKMTNDELIVELEMLLRQAKNGEDIEWDLNWLAKTIRVEGIEKE